MVAINQSGGVSAESVRAALGACLEVLREVVRDHKAGGPGIPESIVYLGIGGSISLYEGVAKALESMGLVRSNNLWRPGEKLLRAIAEGEKGGDKL